MRNLPTPAERSALEHKLWEAWKNTRIVVHKSGMCSGFSAITRRWSRHDDWRFILANPYYPYADQARAPQGFTPAA